MTWTVAQQYCREEFTDLATIDDDAELGTINGELQKAGVGDVWIGLRHGSEYRNWDTQAEEPHEPDKTRKQCVSFRKENGKWHDDYCTKEYGSICYNDGKNWTEAQRYCREKHTDLATIRNQTENDKIKDLIENTATGNVGFFWFGFRDGWEWSDGSSSFFRHWAPNEPNVDSNQQPPVCVEIWSSGRWNDHNCEERRHFVCYEVVVVSQSPFYSGDAVALRCDIPKYTGQHQYGWRRDGSPLRGKTNQTITITLPEDVGQYQCHRQGEDSSVAPYISTPVAVENQDKLVLVNQNKTWKEALEYCRQHHEDLVSVTSEKIQRWVEGWAKGASTPHVWVGLRYSCNLGFWFWFHVVKQLKNWTEAQQYCREEFTDLATIDNMADIDEIKRKMNDTGVGDLAWIGLTQGRWQWSLADEGFYGENEAEFRNWAGGQPTSGNEDERDGEDCVYIDKNGQWHNDPCKRTYPFLCYDADETDSTHYFVLVKEAKNWTEAQGHCREQHTDLASVKNQRENDLITKIEGFPNPGEVWIGLFRDAWEWSDGSNSSFRHWEHGEPNYGDDNPKEFCVKIKSRSGQWNDHSCDTSHAFICYEDKLVLVNESMTWMNALQYCREHHVDLVSVSSEKIQRWVEGWAKGASTTYVWLGLRHSCTFGFWFWVSGDTICYDNFASDGDRMPGCDKTVAAVDKDGGQWFSLEETQALNFICTKDEWPSSTQPYVLVEEEKTWEDAQRFCREKHTDLATIKNEAENDKIKDLIKGKGNVFPWIGLFRHAWEWSDGSSSSYRHWDSHQPSFDSSSHGLCVEIRSSGLWNDKSCDSQRYFVCYEDKLVLVEEQKTWKEALEYCRQHHEDLVSVPSEKIQRWVAGWAKEASTPYVWVGLRYSCNLGFWFWVSGEIICDYDNWVSNQERDRGCTHKVGAVNREGGKWGSFEETRKLNFICTKEEQ
ncbi:macrophage mannose receptor 1-like [Engraulis encrasicolus]|uniref:macrophage mannose receptor 1-like n=1 Tax=Engraulis encrasicolus TaxID=184585 RepID=UPI002FD3892A